MHFSARESVHSRVGTSLHPKGAQLNTTKKMFLLQWSKRALLNLCGKGEKRTISCHCASVLSVTVGCGSKACIGCNWFSQKKKNVQFAPGGGWETFDKSTCGQKGLQSRWPIRARIKIHLLSGPFFF